MRYLPKSESERREMLQAIGAARIEDLFSSIPPEARLNRELNLPPGRSEFEIMDYFKERAAENAPGRLFALRNGASAAPLLSSRLAASALFAIR